MLLAAVIVVAILAVRVINNVRQSASWYDFYRQDNDWLV